MKKIMFILVISIFILLSVSSQQVAYTADGKKVQLNDDGSWKYIQNNDLNSGFRKMVWGSTKDKIKSEEKSEFEYENDKAIMYKVQIAGLDCSAIYIFVNDILVRGRYYFNAKHANKNDYISDYNKMKKMLEEKYGKPISEDQVWKDDLYKNDYSDWGMALATGDMYYYSIWETDDSSIEIQLWGDNYEIKHTIDYTSKELGYLEEQLESENAKNDL